MSDVYLAVIVTRFIGTANFQVLSGNAVTAVNDDTSGKNSATKKQEEELKRIKSILALYVLVALKEPNYNHDADADADANADVDAAIDADADGDSDVSSFDGLSVW